jgi:hypothetical protein
MIRQPAPPRPAHKFCSLLVLTAGYDVAGAERSELRLVVLTRLGVGPRPERTLL